MSNNTKPIESSAKASGKLHPAIPGIGSFLLMGVGQVINKNWIKALCFFLVPVLVCVVEFSSSNWGKYVKLQQADSLVRKVAEAENKLQLIEEKLNNATESEKDKIAKQYDNAVKRYENAVNQYETSAIVTHISTQVVDYGEFATIEEEADYLGIDDEEMDWDSILGGEDVDWEALLAGESEEDYEEEYVVEVPQYQYPRYNLSPNGEKYIIRDFGGFFTKGLWGLVTLGRVVLDQEYAGKIMTLNDYTSRWLTADNSTVLLGNGLITLVFVILYIMAWVLCVVDAIKERKTINETGVSESFKDFVKRLWSNAYVYIMLLPAFILILFFTLIPFLYTFIIAFTNYTYRIKLGASLVQWAGFSAFGQAVADPEWLTIFVKVFLWTVFWAFMSSFTVYSLGFVNAMVIESPMVKGKKIWRIILILPWAIPGLITLMLFKNAFAKDGLINQILYATGSMDGFSNFLTSIGLQGSVGPYFEACINGEWRMEFVDTLLAQYNLSADAVRTYLETGSTSLLPAGFSTEILESFRLRNFDSPIFWFAPWYNGNLAKACVIFVNLWLGAPYHMMMIIGCLATIPRDLYEAADIDGATGWQRFKAITLPSVLSATIPSLIMTFSFNFNNFGAIYFLTGGGPAWNPSQVPDTMRVLGSSLPGQTDILISWIYKLSFTKNSEMFNVAAVYSIFIFLIVGGFAVYSLLQSKSFSEDGE